MAAQQTEKCPANSTTFLTLKLCFVVSVEDETSKRISYQEPLFSQSQCQQQNKFISTLQIHRSLPVASRVVESAIKQMILAASRSKV
jgi:hypothetical protein